MLSRSTLTAPIDRGPVSNGGDEVGEVGKTASRNGDDYTAALIVADEELSRRFRRGFARF
jgi:hypothetical protein